MNDKPKQMIVIRRDLKMRRGKEIAQGCHASQMAAEAARTRNTPAYREWIDGIFTKICVAVSSEEELLKVLHAANQAGLPCGLVTDSGATEFHGVPTNTAVGIGPAFPAELAPITGSLLLY